LAGGPADPELRRELLALALEAEDLRIREALAADGSLSEGYHPAMEAVHRANAARLRELIAAAGGWPGVALGGADGADAAWRVAQHAIGEPAFMRECLALVSAPVASSDAPARHAAYLEDRIAVFEGREQRFGTQLDRGPDGRPVPSPIADPEGVAARRAAAGLEPLDVALARAAAEAPAEPPADPATRARRERAYADWLRRVGWRG
jgi:hypothetical protein